jgi:hypothetical protein
VRVKKKPQISPLRSPRFPVYIGGLAEFMRLSLQKAAYVAIASDVSRKSGYAPVEMTNLFWVNCGFSSQFLRELLGNLRRGCSPGGFD